MPHVYGSNKSRPAIELVKNQFQTGKFLNNKLSGHLIAHAAEASETDETSFLKSDIA